MLILRFFSPSFFSLLATFYPRSGNDEDDDGDGDEDAEMEGEQWAHVDSRILKPLALTTFRNADGSFALRRRRYVVLQTLTVPQYKDAGLVKAAPH